VWEAGLGFGWAGAGLLAWAGLGWAGIIQQRTAFTLLQLYEFSNLVSPKVDNFGIIKIDSYEIIK
jgi:hypothetical protein